VPTPDLVCSPLLDAQKILKALSRVVAYCCFLILISHDRGHLPEFIYTLDSISFEVTVRKRSGQIPVAGAAPLRNRSVTDLRRVGAVERCRNMNRLTAPYHTKKPGMINDDCQSSPPFACI